MRWRVGLFRAALSIAPVPIHLILQHWLTINAFMPLCWGDLLGGLVPHASPGATLSGLDRRIGGHGLENKYSAVFPLAALLFGMADRRRSICTTARRRIAPNRNPRTQINDLGLSRICTNQHCHAPGSSDVARSGAKVRRCLERQRRFPRI